MAYFQVAVQHVLGRGVEVELRQVDKQFYFMQVHQFIVLDGLETQKTLKRSLIFLSLQILFVDSHQLEELQMSAIFSPHWCHYQLVFGE